MNNRENSISDGNELFLLLPTGGEERNIIPFPTITGILLGYSNPFLQSLVFLGTLEIGIPGVSQDYS
jgi:hypothetical protein